MLKKISTLLIGTALLIATPAIAQQPATAGTPKKAMTTQNMLYEVYVGTGDVSGGGTDADVWIFIRGTNGTRDQFLENPGRDDFERGTWSYFRLGNPFLGNITQICMKRNNSGLFPDWYLSQVRVYWSEDNVRRHRTAVFNGWMPSGIWICRNAHSYP